MIETMIKLPPATYRVKESQLPALRQNLDELNRKDNAHTYEISADGKQLHKRTIGQQPLQVLTGEAAQLEDRFLRDKTIKNRQAIVRAFDDMKRGYVAAGEGLDRIKHLIQQQ